MTCPTCGRRAVKLSTYDRVIWGESDGRAPQLAAAWDVTRAVLIAELEPSDDRVRHRWCLEGELPALHLGRAVAAATNVTEVRVRNLLLAAEAAGMVTIRHRVTGKPLRLRAYVRWAT